MTSTLVDVLLKDRVITAQQFQEAASSGEHPIRYLIQKRYLSDSKLLQYLSHKYGLPSINLSKYEISADTIKIIPFDLARKYQIIPIQKNNNVLVCAVADPTMIGNLDDLKFKTKLTIEVLLTSFSALEAAFNTYYGSSSEMFEAVKVFQKQSQNKSNIDINEAAIEIDPGAVTDKDAPIISLVNQVLVECIRKSASDIHIESYENKSRVRLRVDGILQEVLQVPNEMRRPLIARIKIMSKLDISEQRLPQDGRIKIKVQGKEVDFRVSTIPCLFGEKAVLRMLAKGNLQLDLKQLGFDGDTLDVFRKGINQSSGMVLVTGPTGSGKTTTLYSALMELNKGTDNVSTAEDPVEYNLEGINQVQVNKDIGLTFANVLRAFLRQDPDTILVGEIRDLETAEVAIQAAMTGHMVLSTVHTNDAPSTVTRLMNMGVEAFLITACVNTIVAQRLLRKICPRCKEPFNIPVDKLVEYGIPEKTAQSARVFRGRGCNDCGRSGYKGRIAVYEVMDFTPSLKEMVLKGATAIDLKRSAIHEGMKTLRMSGIQKVLEGVTTLEETLAMTASDN